MRQDIARAQIARPSEDPVRELQDLTDLARRAAADRSVTIAEHAQIAALLGQALLNNEKISEARAIEDRAIADLSAHQLDRSAEMARLLVARSNIEYEVGSAEAGLALALRARTVWRQLEGPAAPSGAVNEGNLGRFLYRLNRPREARAAFEAALANPPIPSEEIDYVSNALGLAPVLSALGEEDAAIAQYYRALDLGKRYLPPRHRAWGMIYSELAVHLANVGRVQEALPLAERAVAFFRDTAGPESFDTAASIKNFAFVVAQAGLDAESEQLLNQAIAIFENPKVRVRQLGVMVDAIDLRGEARLKQGHFRAAQEDFSRGLEKVQDGRLLPGLSATLFYDLGRVQLLQGQWENCLTTLDRSILTLRRSAPAHSFFRVRAEMTHALCQARLGRSAEAWAEAVPVAQAMEARLADPRLSLRARQGLQNVYRTNFARYADIAWRTGHREEAFRAAQLAALTEISVSSQALATRAAARSLHADQLANRVQELQNRYAQVERERNLLSRDSSADISRLSDEMTGLEAQLELALKDLRTRLPDYDAIARPQPLPLVEARDRLKADEAYLLPVQTDDALLSIVVSKRGVSGSSARLDSVSAAALVTRLRAGTDAPGSQTFDLDAAHRLGSAVFAAPLARANASVRVLKIVGAGPIMTVPLAMLLIAPPKPGHDARQPFAIRRFAFTTTPALAVPPKRPSPGNATAVLGVGAPTLQPQGTREASSIRLRGAVPNQFSLGDLPELPAAKAELEAINRSLRRPASTILTGAEATEAAVCAEPLAQYDVIAFATHGLVSGELNTLSEAALVLTPPPGSVTTTRNDGLLTASEVAELNIAASWVLLSACNTGVGSENGGGGYASLARGFIQAGARNLLVSLWPVRYDVAARLTVDTVRGYAKGVSQPQALRRAILRLLRDKRVQDSANPAVWAPLALIEQ